MTGRRPTPPAASLAQWRSAARRLVAAACLAIVVSACTVAQSYRVGMAPGEVDPSGVERPRCSSETGSYSLSTTTWAFEIVRYNDSPYVLQEMKENRHPDGRFTYCLDYVANVLASDSINVGYGAANNTGTGLLSYVASFAVDKTPEVIRNLIRAIFVGLSRNPDFNDNRFALGEVEPKVFGRFEVDPLDAEEMAALNVRLADFGFCLLLAGYSVDASVPGEHYCANPRKTLAHAPSARLQAERNQSWLARHPERTGILYRPRIPYTLEIYTQKDPRHSAWQLRKTTEVKLENLAPVVSLRLNRAAFAEARIGLEFEQGVLRNFCIYKSSEIAGFIDIPLDIVYGIAALPSETIRAEINRANATVELVTAQTNLIDAQRKLIDFQKATAPEAQSGLATPNLGNVTNTVGCANSENCPSDFQPTRRINLPANAHFEGAICDRIKDFATRPTAPPPKGGQT
jgi:hypothetical protein